MFVIASTGRCGTQAICDAFEQFSDHKVRHEPEPLLLAEAHAAHTGRWRYSPTYVRRMTGFRRRNNTAYGESVRCPTLVGDITRFAPDARLVVLVRNPKGYLSSAWGRGVLRKGDQYDQWRILPAEAAGRSTIDAIGLHYCEVNRILADTAERLAGRAIVVEVGDLDVVVDRIAGFVGAHITDRAGMTAFLSRRPNAGPSGPWADTPAPELSADVAEQADEVFHRLVTMAAR